MILEKLLIPGEDLDELRQLANDLTETWQPDDLKEQPFVEQLIYHNWLLERLRGVETRIWTEEPDAAKAERRAGNIHRLMAVHERAISRATRDLVFLQKIRAKQSQFSKQSQFEQEIASWPDAKEEEQTQFEYPPIPKGANEANFPTPLMKQQADWRRYKK